MATHQMSLLNGSVLPDTQGNVYWEPYSVAATNDVWRHGVWRFVNSSTRDLLYGVATIPQNYVGTASIIAVWTSTTTTNNVVWDFDYRTVAGDDANSLDQAGTEEAVTVTDTAPGAANRRLTASMSLTSGNLAAGETLEWLFARDGASGSDTMAGDALLFDLILQYADA